MDVMLANDKHVRSRTSTPTPIMPDRDQEGIIDLVRKEDGSKLQRREPIHARSLPRAHGASCTTK
jgi:hypothetical protein